MNNTNCVFCLTIFSCIAVVISGMAQGPQFSEASNAAIPVELVEQKVEQILDSIRMDDAAAALNDIKELSRQPEILMSLKGKPILTRLWKALVASTNEAVVLYLGSVLIQTGDLNLADEMVLLANSEDVAKKIVAAQYLLESGHDDSYVLHAYDILAEVAHAIAHMPRATLSPERANFITNIARGIIRKFDELRINADLAPLRDTLNAADLSAITPYEFMTKQLERIPPWWREDRLEVIESLKRGNRAVHH